MNKIISVIILTLILSGCSWFTDEPRDPIEIESRVQPVPVFHPPLPEVVTWQEVEWKVLTPDIMRDYLAALDAGEAPTNVFYGLTPEGYRALSENVGDIQRYLTQSKAIIRYYRKNLVETVVREPETPSTEEQ